MKRSVLTPIIALVLISTVSPRLSKAIAQNTIFTYQGRVIDNGTNFTGLGQLKLALVTGTNNNRQATATATLTSGFVTAIIVVDGGHGYVTSPAVTITGGSVSPLQFFSSRSAHQINDLKQSRSCFDAQPLL